MTNISLFCVNIEVFHACLAFAGILVGRVGLGVGCRSTKQNCNVQGVLLCIQDTGMWQDALRVCKEYLPHKLQQLQDEYDREMTSNKSGKYVLIIIVPFIMI
jgi:hypothetical protein